MKANTVAVVSGVASQHDAFFTDLAEQLTAAAAKWQADAGAWFHGL